MTVIATDGKTMAADGRMCAGDMIVNDATEKLFYAKDGSVVGTSGDAAVGELLRKWFEAGEPLDALPKVNVPDSGDSPAHALVLRPDGRVQWMNHLCAPVAYAPRAAIGSGSEVAMGQLLAGRSPVEAVRAVATCVSSVGGQVMELAPRAPKAKAKSAKSRS